MTELPAHMRVAVAAAIRKVAAAAETVEKKRFLAAGNLPGTRLPCASAETTGPDGQPLTFGTVSVNKGRKTTVIDIDDAYAIPYMIDRYGEDSAVYTLTAQAVKSLEAEAKAAYEAGKPLPPGVTVTESYGDPTVAWNAEPDDNAAVAEIAAMIRSGHIDLAAVLGAFAPPELEAS